MTQFAPAPRTSAAVAPTAQPSRPQKIADTMAQIDRTYLEPMRPFEKWGATVRPAGSDERKYLYFWMPRPEVGLPRTEEQRSEQIQTLENTLAERSMSEDLSPAADRLRLLQNKQMPAQDRVIIGLLIDSFPNARAHSADAWMEALIHEVKTSGYSTIVVAKAANLLLRSETFPPSVSTLTGRCEDVRVYLEDVLAGYDKGLAIRKVYAHILAELRRAPLWDGTIEGRPKTRFAWSDIGLEGDPFELPSRSSGRVGYV